MTPSPVPHSGPPTGCWPRTSRPRARLGQKLPAGLIVALLLVGRAAAAQQELLFDCETQKQRSQFPGGAALGRSPTAVAVMPANKQAEGYVRVGGGCEVSRSTVDSVHAETMVQNVPDGATGWRCAGKDPANVPNDAWAQATVTYCRAKHARAPSVHLACITQSKKIGPAANPRIEVELTPANVQAGFVVVSGGCESVGVTHSEPVVQSLRTAKGWACQAADPPFIGQNATLTATLLACRVEMDAADQSRFTVKPALQCTQTAGAKVSGFNPQSKATGPRVALGGSCDLSYFQHGSPHAEAMVKSAPENNQWHCFGADPPNIPNSAEATASVVTCEVTPGTTSPVGVASAFNNGSQAEASAYYKQLAQTLGFLTPKTIEAQATLQTLLNYLGYAGLSAADVEYVEPNVLMDLPKQIAAGKAPAVSNLAAVKQTFAANLARPGEVLVSRFFAPKIVDFSAAPAQRKLGWRRLVRLNSRPGSAAKKHFVDSAWILFNHFTEPRESPFGGTVAAPKNGSVNTQVALITSCPDKTPSCAEFNSIYWLDFEGSATANPKLSYQLNAFFDAGSLQGDLPYFVPNGCDTCHGSLRGKAVLNHLDTDHWMDRLSDGDFPTLSRADAPPLLFDAGKVPSAPQYTPAFGVLRTLNTEIETMQTRVHKTSMHLAATKKWLQLHQSSVEPQLDLAARAFAFFNTGHPLKTTRKPTPAPLQWTSSAEDKELLGLLNKYCYRCHGAVRFNVFSKDMVADQTSPMLDRIDPTAAQKKIVGFKMPPDRDIPEADKKRLLKLLDQLDQLTH